VVDRITTSGDGGTYWSIERTSNFEFNETTISTGNEGL
jgi:hypothetical protein